ncbi:hypothetical protein PQR34_32290 [Paraburkholderia sediminicola]|uniref:hypothetical protein n=1 Tax=Paraburkholderia sediminicola TaxID=458836 RepID=UPI0038BA3FCC
MKILLIDIARDLADIAMSAVPHSDSDVSSTSQEALTSIRERAKSLRARVSALLDLIDGPHREAITGWTDSHRQLFGEWCRKSYPNEASAGMIALGEAWMDGLLVGASVALVESAPATDDATSGTTPIELAGVAAAIGSGSGEWCTCASCHESEDGHPVGHYPYSETLGCDLGVGCKDCGGIGAVWDNTDYGAMGTAEATAALAPRKDEDAAQAADAERYRFIKSMAEQCDTGWVRYWRLSTVDMPVDQPGATLDEAIDAARATREPKNGRSLTCQSGEERATRADDRDSRAGYGACRTDR